MKDENRLRNKMWRSCGKKQRYKTEHDARIAIKHYKSLHRSGSDDLDFYFCTYCNGWHITHFDADLVYHDKDVD